MLGTSPQTPTVFKKMAIYALEIKHRTKGKGASARAHADYIAREGKYGRGVKGHELEYLAHGNIPEWASEKPMDFWDAADTYERANGRVYSEIQVALPRELSRSERTEAIRELIQEELGDRHAYTVAIHNSKAMDGGDQPHAHIMFSIRELDGVKRSRELFFRRANDKNPEKGGARKSRDWSKDSRENDRINEIRVSWERIANGALEQAGREERIDRRTLKEQGIDREPEPKMGPKVTQRLKRGEETEKGGKVVELRDYRKKQEEVNRLEKEVSAERGHLYEFKEEERFEQNLGEGSFYFQGRRREVSDEEKQKYQKTVDLVFTRTKREDGNTEFRWKKSGRVAFTDEGDRITFNSANQTAVKAGLQVAKEKGWDLVQVKGSEEFRRESWLQGKLMGLEVTGYNATKADYERLDGLKQEKEEQHQAFKAKEREGNTRTSEGKANEPRGSSDQNERVRASDFAKALDERIKNMREQEKSVSDPAETNKLRAELDELYRDKHALKTLGDREITVNRQSDGSRDVHRIQLRKMAKQVEQERSQGKSKDLGRGR